MANVIINPGSGPLNDGTIDQARHNAGEWLEMMTRNGIQDVEIMDNPQYDNEGRWTFIFKHKVTGVECTLGMHGLTPKQIEQYVFKPRIYWNGCSSSSPELDNFLTDGYRIAIVEDETGASIE